MSLPWQESPATSPSGLSTFTFLERNVQLSVFNFWEQQACSSHARWKKLYALALGTLPMPLTTDLPRDRLLRWRQTYLRHSGSVCSPQLLRSGLIIISQNLMSTQEKILRDSTVCKQTTRTSSHRLLPLPRCCSNLIEWRTTKGSGVSCKSSTSS